MTPTATQRPGWRTGTASITPGRSDPCAGTAPGEPGAACPVELMSDGPLHRVDREVGDRALLDAPSLQRLLVAAILLQRLQRNHDGSGEVGVVLGDHVTVGGCVVDVAEGFQLAAGLLHRVGDDRESANMASSLPAATAAVASSCFS